MLWGEPQAPVSAVPRWSATDRSIAPSPGFFAEPSLLTGTGDAHFSCLITDLDGSPPLPNASPYGSCPVSASGGDSNLRLHDGLWGVDSLASYMMGLGDGGPV